MTICLFQLYEQILAENEKLKAQLRDTDLELADLKQQLEKATQVRWAPESVWKHPSVHPLTLAGVFAETGALRRPIPAGDGEKGKGGTRLTSFITNIWAPLLRLSSEMKSGDVGLICV